MRFFAIRFSEIRAPFFVVFFYLAPPIATSTKIKTNKRNNEEDSAYTRTPAPTKTNLFRRYSSETEEEVIQVIPNLHTLPLSQSEEEEDGENDKDESTEAAASGESLSAETAESWVFCDVFTVSFYPYPTFFSNICAPSRFLFTGFFFSLLHSRYCRFQAEAMRTKTEELKETSSNLNQLKKKKKRILVIHHRPFRP